MKKILCVLVVILLLFGCSAKKESETAVKYYNDGYAPMADEKYSLSSDLSKSDGQIVIYNGGINFETEHYDDFINELMDKLSSYQAVTTYKSERSNGYGNSARYLTLTINVPAESFDKFINDNEYSYGVITNVDAKMDDITETYNQTELKIETLLAQLNRLNELIESAESLEDIILLEDKISKVQEELTWYSNSKNSMDSKIKYSTINISVSEVNTYSQTSFIQRIGNAFSGSWHNFLNNCENFVVWLIYFIPTLIVLVILFVVFKKPLGNFLSGLKNRLTKKNKPTNINE